MGVRYIFFLLFFVLSCKTDSEKVTKNIVNIRLEGEPSQINPVLTSKAYYKQIEWQIFMPLLQYDAKTLALHPVLAISRPEVEAITEGVWKGGRKYIFEIRPEAKWDDGRPVIANDFIFSLKALLHPEIGSLGFRTFLSFIKMAEVDPLNSKRFSIYTDRAFNLAEEVLGTMAVYPSHFYDAKNTLGKYKIEEFIDLKGFPKQVEKDSLLQQFADQFKQAGFPNTKDQIKGCGPYEIESWTIGQNIRLKKKSSWWGEKKETIHQSFGNGPDQLNYHFIEADVTLATLLKDQKIDVAASIDPGIFDDLKKSDLMQEAFNFYTPVSPSYYFVSFNMNSSKLNDTKTRRALSHLMDVETAIEVAMNGYGERTIGPILPVKDYYHKGLKPIEFDIAAAQTLLAEAGWKDSDQDGVLERNSNGIKVDFSLTYKYTNSNAVAEKVGLLLKDNAIKAGIRIDLIPLEFNRLIEETRARDFDLYCSRWSQRPGLDDLRNIWHTQNDSPRGFNKAGFGNAYTDALIDSINVVLVEKQRTKMYHEVQEIIYQEQPYIFLFVPTERMVLHKRFEGEASALRPGYFENTLQLKSN